jgi:hypothetical protein
MIALTLLAACGDFGLTTFATTRRASDDDTGYVQGDDRGGGDGGGSQSGADDEEVAVSLTGHTWAVDLAEVRFVEPPGMAAVLSFMDSTVLLFHASKQSKKELELVVTLAAADGTQDPCQRVQRLPTADWTNPVFAVDEGQLDIDISGESVAFKDALLSAAVDADGDGWHDGVLAGRIDAREFAAALPEGTDVCNLVDGMGGQCSACSDGEVQCFDLDIEAIRADPAVGDFDPSPSCG